MMHLWVSGYCAGICSSLILDAYLRPTELRRWDWWAVVLLSGGWAVFRYFTPYA